MPSERTQIPIEMLGRLLIYDDMTGRLTWRERDVSLFADGRQTALHNCAIFNAKFAGKPALNAPDKRGYLCGCILRKPMKAHRAIWAMKMGHWPDEVDHINGDPADNRIENLRSVSHSVNGRNLKLKANNRSGFCGVHQAPSGRWKALITVNRKSITLGTFDTIEEAAEARSIAERKYQFHPNHGRR